MSVQTPDSFIESQANGMCCDDAGFCSYCDGNLDAGHCNCETCHFCENRIQDQIDNGEAREIEVKHVVTGEPVKVWACVGCAEKLEDRQS